jgi:hypothetical protein
VNTFPFDSWEEASEAAINSGAGYFTFGPGGNTATIIVVALGFLVMLITIIAGIMQEDRRLAEHAERLRQGGDNNAW